MNASGATALARKSSGNRNTELKPIALWIAPHQTRTLTSPPAALDSTQARPQARALSHDTPKFSARMKISQIDAAPFMRSFPRARRSRAQSDPPPAPRQGRTARAIAFPRAGVMKPR